MIDNSWGEIDYWKIKMAKVLVDHFMEWVIGCKKYFYETNLEIKWHDIIRNA